MRGELERRLGLGSATALVFCEVVGIGIFLTPAGMLKSLGSPLWTLLVWLAMGAMALCGALCYGELASRYPRAGGGYVYLREAYGRPLAFLYGWMSLLVMDCGLSAALSVGLAAYCGALVPLTPGATRAVAVGAILSLAALNVAGVRPSVRLIAALTGLKLGSLLLLVLFTLVVRTGSAAHFLPFVARRPDSGALLPALAAGSLSAFFSFGGWWDLGKLAGEVRQPGSTLPRALVYGVALVTLVYVSISATFLYLVPLEAAGSGETFAAQAGEVLFGHVGGRIFTAIVLVAVLGSLASIMLTAPRVYLAMARDGLFVPGVASISPRFHTPVRAILVHAVLASLLAMVASFRQIVGYFIFVAVLFLALSVAALFVVRRRHTEGGFRAPGYPYTPWVFLSFSALLLVLLAAGNPRQSLLGVAVVALGLPVYRVFFRRATS